MKNIVFYFGLALLFTHELDAMPNHEWRLLPILSSLSDSMGESAFIAAHVPIFALTIALVASLKVAVRDRARYIASGFLIIHAILHYLYSTDDAYEFSSTLSPILIYGAAFSGIAYLLLGALGGKADAA